MKITITKKSDPYIEKVLAAARKNAIKSNPEKYAETKKKAEVKKLDSECHNIVDRGIEKIKLGQRGDGNEPDWELVLHGIELLHKTPEKKVAERRRAASNTPLLDALSE